MKKTFALLTIGFSMNAFAYQVTGPVVDVTDKEIVVMKGKDKWTLAKSAATTSEGEITKGSKVTIEYSMTADKIVAKKAK